MPSTSKKRKRRVGKKRARKGAKKGNSPVEQSSELILEDLIKEIEGFLRENRIHEAAMLAARGLEIFSDSVDMLMCAGAVQEKAGNFEDAAACFEAAAKLEPSAERALSELANLLVRHHQWKRAIPVLEELRALKPEDPTVLLTLGTACLRLSKHQQAVSLLEKARAILPDNIAILTNLGITYRFLRQYDKAFETLSQGLNLDRQDGFMLSSLASVCADMGKHDMAIEYANQAVERAPRDVHVISSSAYPFVKRGLYAKATELYHKALSIDSGHSGSRFGLGTILLLHGKFEEGWPLYQARFDIMQSWLNGPWPVWQGEDIRGKTLFVRAEQGAGDTIQFCRFIPALKAMGANVIFSFQPPLGRLLSCLERHAKLFPKEKIDVCDIDADLQAALLDLPFLMGIKDKRFIRSEPSYINVSSELRKKWHDKIASFDDVLKVGLVWAGNPKHIDDHNRSINLSMLEPLGKIPHMKLFSLQIGNASEQVDQCRKTLPLVDFTLAIDDFADTAGFIENLDVVVSVDTATAHLAGALGKPVVILLPFSPDWRWFLKGEDSPWYPTARLLRQREPGEWGPVVEKLCELLKGWAEKRVHG